MGKREDKITRAAHIKRHTRGTSNEISFSVLDAAKNALEGDDDGLKHRPGRISLFTLPGKRKKPAPTPTKERGCRFQLAVSCRLMIVDRRRSLE
ncbi:MAG: hypothetical protein ACLVMH_11790 [Christensenellales bacterium]